MTSAKRSERFRPLVERQPANEKFRFSLGQALLEEGAAAEAIPHLEFCAAHDAQWMMARILLGQALRAVGRAAEAKHAWTDALRLAVEQHHETPEAELRGWLAELANAAG